jgi:hypothetical protein
MHNAERRLAELVIKWFISIRTCLALHADLSVDTVVAMDVNNVEWCKNKSIARDLWLMVSRLCNTVITQLWQHYIQLCHYI